MKTNLKTFPTYNKVREELLKKYPITEASRRLHRITLEVLRWRREKWKANLETELRAEDFLKVWVNAHDRSLIKEILGDD